VVGLRLEDEDPAATEFLLDYCVRADDGTFVLCDETVVPTLSQRHAAALISR
jgi:hypothetical protein